MRSVERVVVAAASVMVLATLSAGVAAPAARAASPRVTFFFGLARPEAAARSAFFSVQRPGSATYRRFLSQRQVAARYGASARVRTRFRRLIRDYGFAARVDRSGAFARVSGTVARFERVFNVSIRHLQGDDPPTNAFAARGTLRLPAPLKPLVDDVATAYERQTRVGPAARTAARPKTKPRPPRRTGTWIQGCANARKTGAFSYAQIRHAYGIDRLGSGAGASIALLGLQEAPSRRDIADNARCFGYVPLRSTTLLTDGQIYPISPGDDFEPREDMAAARGMAPVASLTFTQAVSSADLWFLGASQILDRRRLPDTFSISYGICEAEVVGHGPGADASTRAGANLLNAMIVRLGLAGVRTDVSAGDGGSSCNGYRSRTGRPLRGVAWPAASPYVTAVGGTRLTLNRANRRTGEVVWNDLRWRSASAGTG